MQLTTIGAICCLLGVVLMAVCLIVHFVLREQDFTWGVVFLFVFVVFAIVMAALIFVAPDDKTWCDIFGALALIFPALSVLVVGAGILLYTFVVGINAVSVVLFLFWLSALLGLSGSIVTLVGASSIPTPRNSRRTGQKEN